jgi:glycosyltransferase involved in cell wall biosynthesis
MSEVQPIVSIIIATYNCRSWICEAVDSALAQSYPNCQVIVVDDGSKDGTGALLQERYDKAICYLHKENGGLSSARNLGLSYARGEYIQFLDADDILLPEKVAEHLAFLNQHPEVDVVYGDAITFQKEDQSDAQDWIYSKHYRSGIVFEEMVREPWMLCHAALTRRRAIENITSYVLRGKGPFDESLSSSVDGDFWLRLAHSEARFHYLAGEPRCRYRHHGGNQSHQRVSFSQNVLTMLDKIRVYVPDQKTQERIQLNRLIGKWKGVHGESMMLGGLRFAACKELATSLWLNPAKPWYRLFCLLSTALVGPKITARMLRSYI